MFQDPAPESRNGPSKFFAVSSALILLAAVYVAWVFYSRWQDEHTRQQQAAADRRAVDSQIVQNMGGNRFDILGFYADPAIAHPGDTVELCYSVSNAKTVKLEPQSEPVWPAYSHCVQVMPRKTTTYTFTAEDAAGHTKAAKVEVQVR
jgi:hypothetical protein